MDFVDYYALLGLEPTATAKEIKKAIKEATLKYHPDKAKSEEEVKERTRKTAQINNAKDELLKPDKRAAYDERYQDYMNPDPEDDGYNRRQERRRRPENPGGDYHDQENERPLRKPKYVPGSTASPYRGFGSPRVFYFSGDGKPGDRGIHGLDGRDGTSPGQDGSDGRNATTPTNGGHGTDYKIYLDTVQAEEGHLEISVLAAAGYELSNRNRQPEFTPIKLFQSVDFTCRGGKGGDGGNGGDGGQGARGYRGRDATRYSNGTDGGPGGNGGDGGLGTSGAHGGRGGYVTYFVDEEDTYILMRAGGVDPIDREGDRVKGGSGGASGRHGSGGNGGPGGSGGSSYSWTETRQRQDSNGNWYADCEHYKNPGGWSGRSGRRGATPSPQPTGGMDGDDGTVRISVKMEDGRAAEYDRRYDLAFQSSRHRHRSDMGEHIFEFGETVHVTHLLLRNSGYMPTPKQRVMLGISSANEVNPVETGRILVARGLSTPPGEMVSANQGFLSFDCPYPEATEMDFEPIRKKGWIKYSAVQLGPENNKAPLARLSDFQAPYTRVHNEQARDELHMAFPIENQNGIRGIRSLDAQETTFVLLTITNTSLQSFGRMSSTGRPLSVQFQYVQAEEYKINVGQICVRDANGNIVKVRPGRSGDRGYETDLQFLEAGADVLVQVSLKLNTDANSVRPGAKAGLQAKIFLDDIPVLNPDGSSTSREDPKRLIQSRLFEVSCQPKFNKAKKADVILLTTTESKDFQIEAWDHLVDRLGLSSKIYSLTRYGHVSSDGTVEEDKLKDLFKGALVVFLNDEYKPRPNDRQHRHDKARPSQLLHSAYDFDETTKFLVVGGKLNSVEHLTPNSDSYSAARRDIPIDIPNRKGFKEHIRDAIHDERLTGFAESSRSVPKKYTVSINVSFFREPNEDTVDRVLSKRCRKMQSWVSKQDNLRHCWVTWVATSVEMKKEGTFKNTWSIGELQITLGVPSTQKSVVWVSEEGEGEGRLSSPMAIKSNSMTHAVLSALHLEKRIDCFVEALHALGETGDNPQAKTTAAISRDCLVNDFLADIASYRHGRFKVEDTRGRSRTLCALSKHNELCAFIDECLGNEELKSVAAEELGALVAALRCCAKSLDLRPWWNPFSSKHSVRKAMTEAVTVLEVKWANIFDEEKVTETEKSIRMEVEQYIKARKKKRIIVMRARGRYRAALEHLHSPTNVDKYPANRDLGPTSNRVRDEHTMTSGESRKRKKSTTSIQSPEQRFQALSSVKRRFDFTEGVFQAAIKDIEEFGQTDIQAR